MVQGELFREDANFDSKIGSQRSFLSKYQLTLRLDKILLLLIAAIFAFTLSHTFGVERGKRLMEKKYESAIPSQVQTVQPHDPMNDPNEIIESETVLMVNQAETATAPGNSIKVGLELPPPLEGPLGRARLVRTPPIQVNVTPTPSELKKLGNFTVQLVTYDSKSLADKEISRLKLKGYEGFIIPSGRFFQVCANYFDDKSKARSQLEEFKQTGRYPDAYVRPVTR